MILWIVQALKGPNDEKNNYDPGFVDIVFQEIQDVFLNDRVLVNSRLEVQDVSTKIENG